MFVKMIKVTRQDAHDMRQGRHRTLCLQDIGGHESVRQGPVRDREYQPFDLLVGHGATEDMQHTGNHAVGEEWLADESTKDGKQHEL